MKPIRRWLRLAVVVLAGAAAVYTLRGRMPDPAAVLDAMRGADLRWTALAVLAQAGSQAMFAHQQRRLLGAFEVGLPMPRALAITYSRSAISMALPAGPAVSAAFAMQQYGRSGASRAVAATVTILSGVASAAGLVLLYGAGMLVVASLDDTAILTGSTVLASAAALLAWSGSRSARHSRTGRGAVAVLESPTAPNETRRRGRLGAALDRALAQLADAARRARTVPAHHWPPALAAAVANWSLDVACLVAVARACDLGIGYPEIAGVYLAVQIVRQIPVTPGGIGLIETSLLTGLVAAGATQPAAAAVVLGYRLISFWLILPVGLATYLGLRDPKHA